MTKFYTDEHGNFIGGFDGAEPPVGSIQVPFPPLYHDSKWDGNGWVGSRDTILKLMDSAIEGYIQQQVRDLGGYVSVERLVSVYSNSPHPTWKSHALAVPNWVTAIWVKADYILQEVDKGRPIPTTDELVAELPKIADFITPVA